MDEVKQKRIFIIFCLAWGIFLLVQVLMPIIAYQYWVITTYNQNKSLVSPDLQKSVLGVSLKNEGMFPFFNSTLNRDYSAGYEEFSLSIPKINIIKAQVIVDSNTFDDHLAHLPGSALPGEKGNVFITGHSSLPQFFSKDNYKAIFSNLPKINKGDEIMIDTGSQVFTYVVTGMQIVDPSETWVINPPDTTGRYLTLMTCVPPGLYLKRLIVTAQLKE